MATKLSLLFVITVILFSFATCGDSLSPAPDVNASVREQQPAPASPRLPSSGRVVETINAGSYTYVLVGDSGEESWWAGPKFNVKVGDMVLLPPTATPMRGFRSSTLNRTFDLVYFAQSIKRTQVEDVEGTVEQVHRKIPARSEVAVDAVTKADGGITVADVFARGKEFAGSDVRINAKVVKFSSGILGKNWVHVQDGTGSAGSNDLTVTTQATVKVGDTVLVEGRLVADKDLGYGYKYDFLVEDAKLTVLTKTE